MNDHHRGYARAGATPGVHERPLARVSYQSGAPRMACQAPVTPFVVPPQPPKLAVESSATPLAELSVSGPRTLLRCSFLAVKKPRRRDHICPVGDREVVSLSGLWRSDIPTCRGHAYGGESKAVRRGGADGFAV
jgi:hypothetical protein